MDNYFGIGVFHPKFGVNIGTLMRSAYCFGASFVFTIGRRYKVQSSDVTKIIKQMPVYHYVDMDDMLSHLPIGNRVVGIELADNAKDIVEYSHPMNCVYLLGAEDHSIPEKDLVKCHEVVQVNGLARCLNVASTGSIVMFDRNAKLSKK